MGTEITYAIRGAWRPQNGRKVTPNQSTFSLGIYPLVARKQATHPRGAMKAGKVVFRIVGSTSAPEKADDLAERLLAALNSGRLHPEDIKQRRFDARNGAYDGWLL